MRFRIRKYFVFLLLIFGLLSSGTSSPTSSVINRDTSFLYSDVISGLDEPNVTWTSRTQLEPQLLGNGSSAIGDHVVLNATFPDNYNVTLCEIRIWNGFTYTTTRPLVIPKDPWGVFDGIINHTQFDWVVIKGIEKGLRVNITCNFTNDDSDFMAWDGTQDPSEYTYADNIVEMASGDNPEHDSFIWSSENDTMILGCLDYDGMIGNWTLNLQVGADMSATCNDSTISLDPYYIDARNQTYTINVTGYTESNTTYTITREDVRICNFFAPIVTVYPVVDVPFNGHNISWSSTDRNADDVNYYSVWLSNNDGISFMLLAQNLTRTYLLWNSSGWLDGDYIFRIRAYSIDLTVPGMADLSDPPAGYWPGDYGDGYSIQFYSNGPPRPLTDVGVNQPSDVMYEQGATGNYIVWRFNYSYSYYYPHVLTYEIYRNSELLTRRSIYFYYDGPVLSVNIDGLQDGVHNYTLYYENPGASGGYVQDVVFVIVNKPFFNTTTSTTSWNPFVPILLQTFLVISIPGVALVVLIAIVNKGFDRDIIKRMYDSMKKNA